MKKQPNDRLETLKNFYQKFSTELKFVISDFVTILIYSWWIFRPMLTLINQQKIF